ncbi:MAG: GAF domain-containing protein, partial [Candidatus Omnitrophica bacterium]|nr:GAF domain-containing protein [Candidatus Omnitrophota bacterium]
MLGLNAFTFAGLLLGSTSFGLAFICIKFGKSKLHKIWALFNISVGLWGFGAFLIGKSSNMESALINWKLAHIGGIFIPVCFYHTISSFCNLHRKVLIRFAYAQGLFFLLLLTTNLFIDKVEYVFGSFYYTRSIGFFYPLFFIIWIGLVIGGHYELIKYYRKAPVIKRNQILYFFLGMLTGFLGGVTNFLPMFRINMYPYGNFTIPIYCLIVTYAILRYRLMDISIAITRTGIFVTVYSLVLGIPFIAAHFLRYYFIGLLGDNWWIGPLILSTSLATTGPFIYLYIQRKAEDRLLREQRRYQQTLRRASAGMTRIRNLKKLLNLIVHIVTRTVHIKHSSIYLLDPQDSRYTLQAYRDKRKARPSFAIEANSDLIDTLKRDREPIVYEEIKQRAQDYSDSLLFSIQKQLELLDASVVVPSFAEENLLGFIVLGEKASGQLYSQDDLVVFSVLANQSALAIENAQFYEDIKETQTQLFQAEKMATIGTMADGLSHQINNRFHALGMIAADSWDALNSINENSPPKEIHEIFSQIRHALERVKENVKQGGEVVHGILKYSRKGEVGFEAIELDRLINVSLEMVQYKVKLSQIDLVRDYSKDIPKIKGNLVQLQEVFFNLIDNAYDSIVERKNGLKEPGYRGNVTIQAVSRDSEIEIRFIDNGMGIRDADVQRLFTPFFTTKTSSRKGTGLGLYVIQKII